MGKYTGQDIPDDDDDIARQFKSSIREVDMYYPHISWDFNDLAGWLKNFGIDFESDRSRELFEVYYANDHVVFTTLVEHPIVDVPSDYKLCSIVNQRATIFHDGERQSMEFRSYFHSSRRDGSGGLNFVPSGAVAVDFPSREIWFPLALTEVIDHRSSNVELDIITPKPLGVNQLPQQLGIIRSCQIERAGREYSASRVRGQLRQGEQVSDLRIPVG